MEVRISGINLAVNKDADIALTSIFGIGRMLARSICQNAGVKPSIKIRNLNDSQVDAIRVEVGKIPTEGELRRKVAMDIKRKIDIGCFEGLRHRRGLPLKGRTRTNARTRKGKRRQIVRAKEAK